MEDARGCECSVWWESARVSARERGRVRVTAGGETDAGSAPRQLAKDARLE